jgi:hypothetical protein
LNQSPGDSQTTFLKSKEVVEFLFLEELEESIRSHKIIREFVADPLLATELHRLENPKNIP